MQHVNQIPIPDSVKVLTNVDVFDEGLKKFDFKVHIGLRKINSPTPYGSFGRRVINPLLNDKKHLIVDYMREVNMIDESVPYEKPSKYKFNLVSR